jgi:hypothetical protein
MTNAEYAIQLALAAPPLTESQVETAARILASVTADRGD